MKIRNGFVSNSSSSSFIINYPKTELKMEEIVSYFGGFDKRIPEYIQGVITYMLWKSQYNSVDHYSYDRIPNIAEEERYICTQKRNEYYSDEVVDCPKNFTYVHDGHDEYSYYYDCYESCEGCEFWKSITEEEYVDYLLESCYKGETERIKSLEAFKKDCGRIIRLTIDDNDPGDNISWEDASLINDYAGHIFKSHDKILEEGR